MWIRMRGWGGAGRAGEGRGPGVARAPWCAGRVGAGSTEFGFADGLEVGHAGGVGDGAVEADARPATVELEGGEHVVEPGAAGDPPPEPRPGRPGQPGEPG